jgi:hypothetical protein
MKAHPPGCVCPECRHRRQQDELIEQMETDLAELRARLTQRARLGSAGTSVIMPDTRVVTTAGPPVSAAGPGPAVTYKHGEPVICLPGPHAYGPDGKIFKVTRIREVTPGVWVPDSEHGTHAVKVQQLNEPGNRRRKERPAAGPEPDEAEQLRQQIHEPFGLDYEELAAKFPDRPPGACQVCHNAPVKRGRTVCWYCDTLRDMKRASPEETLAVRAADCAHASVRDGTCRRCGKTSPLDPAEASRRYRRYTTARISLLLAGFTLAVVAAHVWAALIPVAVLLIAIALAGWRR